MLDGTIIRDNAAVFNPWRFQSPTDALRHCRTWRPATWPRPQKLRKSPDPADNASQVPLPSRPAETQDLGCRAPVASVVPGRSGKAVREHDRNRS